MGGQTANDPCQAKVKYQVKLTHSIESKFEANKFLTFGIIKGKIQNITVCWMLIDTFSKAPKTRQIYVRNTSV